MAGGRSKYILGERIAQGGMAEIYLGKIVGSEGFTRLCAFKKVLPNFAEDVEFMEMFRNEAMVAKQLQNKNIVQVYDFESDFDQGPMLVMEYVDGQDLRSILRETERVRQKIPIELAVYITAEVLNGLGFAHASVDVSGKSLGIIHRDVSPQNILVSFEGDVKITDFGIAKVQSAASNTRAGVLKGKFRYMAPEQAKGEGIDARSDVFAMGIVLYEMLTMTRLFKGDDDFQILQAVRECKVRSPNEVKGVSIPPELESIVLKLLAREPSARYSTARDAVKDLTRFLYSYRKDFFPGELAEFMQKIFTSKLEASRDRMRSTLALPVDVMNSPVSRGGGESHPDFVGVGSASKDDLAPDFAAAAFGRPGSTVDYASSKSSSNDGQRSDRGIEQSSPFSSKSGMFGEGSSVREIKLKTNVSVPPDVQMAPRRVFEGTNPRIPGQAVRRTNVGASRAERGSSQIKPRGSSSVSVVEKILVIVAVLLVAGSIGFYVALHQRAVRFPSVLELKPAMEAHRRVKIRVDGQAFKGGSWIDLPVQIQLEWGNHVVQISKPGFRDQKLNFSASMLGTTFWGSNKVESVLLGKDLPLGNVLILTDPEGARVSIDDDQFTGVSGRQIEFVPVRRRYKIRIEHPRCQVFVGEIEVPAVAAGEIFTKQFALKGCR